MAAGPERDEVIVKNWREQWLANGRPSGAWTADQMEKMMAHIAAARTELQHQSFVAVSRNNGEVIGSAACQLWSGPMPATHERVGTCWGVFVKPEWRRKGVASAMLRAYFKRPVGALSLLKISFGAARSVVIFALWYSSPLERRKSSASPWGHHRPSRGLCPTSSPLFAVRSWSEAE